jgi:uncharacterized protein (TIGR03437 family)
MLIPLMSASMALAFALALTPGPARAATSVPLVNPGMEAPYLPVSLNNGAIAGQIANGWSENSAWANATVQYAQETNNPHGGSSCQKVLVQSVGSGRMQFYQLFQLQAGNIYTASVWLRGTPGVQASLLVQKGSPPYATYVESSLTLTPDWQQVTAIGYITTTESAYLMIAMSTPGTVWVDDFALSFAPGTIAPTPNLGPIPLSFFGIHVGNFLQSRLMNSGFEPPYVSVGVNNPISGNVAVAWGDNSSWGNPNPTVTYSQETNNPHGGTSSQKVSVQNVPPGDAVQLAESMTVLPGETYTLTAWMRGDRGMKVNLILQNANSPYSHYAETPATLTGDWQQFSAHGQVNDTGALLLMFQAPGPGTFWVDDVSFVDSSGNPVSGGVPWPQATFGTLRLWDSGTSWTSLEPQKGVWNWEPLDTWVAAAQAHGVKDILLTLGQSPPWASSNPDQVNYVGAGAPAPPANIQDWRDYITAVAQRYKGLIRYYEIWNEPNDPTYYSGTVAELVQLTREAHSIIKAVDPGNTVISPAAYMPGYLDQLLQAGIAGYVDIIGHHFYQTPPEATGAAIANVRLVLAKNNVSSIPLWDTEGASGDTTTPPDLAAAYIVRKYLADLAFGSGRYDWYTWGHATSFCVGTEANDPRILTQAALAYRYLFDWLLGASLDGASIDPAGNWQIRLTLATGAKGLIIWNPAQNRQFTVPQDLRALTVRDIFGSVRPIQGSTLTVTDSPILISSCCQSPPAVNAVTNAASFTNRISPGSLAAIFGTGFASSATWAGSIPLSTSLAGVSVFVDGMTCPLLYADGSQINFQIPSEIQPGSGTVFVTSASGISQEFPVTVDAASPGIFQYGQNRAVATNGLGPLNSPESPAPAGSVIVAYLTGIGPLSATPADGTAPPLNPLAQAILPASATIGGVNAPVQFLGLTPTLVGLAQANIQVPALPTGDYPLVIAVGGASSGPATVSVTASLPAH